MFKEAVNAACINGVFSRLTIHAMHESFKRLTEIAASGRLVAAVTGGSALAAALNESPQTVHNWRKRGVSEGGAIKAAKLFGGAADYILDGSQQPQQLPPKPGVAHDLSEASNTVAFLRLSWEGLMGADLSRPFELVVRDDALADEIVSGSIARFHPAGARAATPGRPVLVRDKDGNHYLRDYQAGPGTRWKAVARKRGYDDLDSEEHGLVLVAVMKGVDWA